MICSGRIDEITGMGGGSLVSVRLGQKRNDEANQIASTAFFTAIGIVALITLFVQGLTTISKIDISSEFILLTPEELHQAAVRFSQLVRSF